MIKLFSNREVLVYFVKIGILTFLSVLISFFTPGFLAVLFLGTSLIVLSFRFTLKRYAEIENLSDNLTKILKGSYDIDIREYRSGELSILKTEIYKLTQVLINQSRQLREDKEFLKTAISNISHQLKTPVTSLMLMTELINDESTSKEKKQEFSENMDKILDRIQWLTETLLKISKIEAEAVEFTKKEVPAETLVSNALTGIRLDTREKNPRFLIQVPENTVLLTDPYWFNEALTNILQNALRHGQRHITVEITCKENNLYKEFIIKDNGPGIAKEDLPHIFEKFYKGKNSAPESTGIGLSLTKSIVEGLGGRIEVCSDEKGTCFTLKLYD